METNKTSAASVPSAGYVQEARDLLKKHCVKGYVTTIDAVAALVEVMERRDQEMVGRKEMTALAAQLGRDLGQAKLDLENIAGNAPGKEPRNEPTVGFQDDRRVDAEQANDAIQQAFNEGHTRAWWEAGQMADAAIAKATGQAS